MENRYGTSKDATQGVSGFMLGILVGSAVAAAVTMFYTPRSGPELRNRLRDEVTETQQMFQTWMNDIKERAESFRQIFGTEFKNTVQTAGDGRKQE